MTNLDILEKQYEDDNVVVTDYLVVYRYIRPDGDHWGWPTDYEINENLYGITVRFDVDYLTRIVTAGWSICEGDNFSKEIGRNRADLAYVTVTFNLEDVDLYSGLVNALMNKLSNMYPKYACYEDSCISDKIRLFKRALRG